MKQLSQQKIYSNQFVACPIDSNGEYLNRINIVGEINLVQDFQCNELQIVYELVKPEYWKFDYDENLLEEQDANDDEQELNRSSSITQYTTVEIGSKNDGQLGLVGYFSFPLDWQFKINPKYLIKRPPILCLQVNSQDSWGRTQIQGYGFCEIPKQAGFHQICIQTWKPMESMGVQIQQFYLGGSTKLKNLRKIAETSFKNDRDIDCAINRSETLSESSGSIIINLNCAIQSREYKLESKSQKQTTQEKQNVLKKKDQVVKSNFSYEMPNSNFSQYK